MATGKLIHRTGPLPDNHPFKHGLIVFGAKRPSPSAPPSTPAAAPTTGPAGPSGAEGGQVDPARGDALLQRLMRTKPLPIVHDPVPVKDPGDEA